MAHTGESSHAALYWGERRLEDLDRPTLIMLVRGLVADCDTAAQQVRILARELEETRRLVSAGFYRRLP
jgi:hypothetical protein